MTKKYMSVREYAARHMVCAATVYAMCAQGTLPHVRLGVGRGTIRIPVEETDVDEWRIHVSELRRHAKEGLLLRQD